MENVNYCGDCQYCRETDSPDWRECYCDKHNCAVMKNDVQCNDANSKNIDDEPLTYEWMEQNFTKDELTPPMSIYAKGMYRDEKYFIGMQLTRTCDVSKHLLVHNYENKITVEIRDEEISQIKSKKRFTIGDLKTLLHLVGLDDLIEKLKK